MAGKTSRRFPVLSVFVAVILLAGAIVAHAHLAKPRYEFVATAEGMIAYRLDTETGEVVIVSPRGIRKLGAHRPPVARKGASLYERVFDLAPGEGE